MLPLLASLAACEVRLGPFDDGDIPSSGSWTGGSGYTPGPIPPDDTPPACDDAPIDLGKELVALPPTWGGRVSDGPEPVSFAEVVQYLAPESTSTFVADWLGTWKLTAVPAETSGGATIPLVPRATVDSTLVCPWLRRTPSNACDEACGYCRERRLDPAQAPFRLAAIVNRIDLGLAAGACGARGGSPADAEVRLVFTAVDTRSGAPLPFTAIFEYDLGAKSPDDLTRAARQTHALGRLAAGPAYARAIRELLAPIVLPSDGTLPRLRWVRTNEIALGAKLGLPWELREHLYTTTASGPRLAPQPLTHTPDLAYDDTETLATWLRTLQASDLGAARTSVPVAMRTAASWTPTSSFAWSAPGLADSTVLDALNATTCNGCHGARAGGVFQHVRPTAAGVTLSTFLTGRDAADGELARRARLLRPLVVCSPGAGGSTGGSTSGSTGGSTGGSTSGSTGGASTGGNTGAPYEPNAPSSDAGAPSLDAGSPVPPDSTAPYGR